MIIPRKKRKKNIKLTRVLKRFKNVQKCSDGWSARCPAHNDHRNSLSIGLGKNGTILFHCHAGCIHEEVIGAANLKPIDLRLPKPKRPRGKGKTRQFIYKDENRTTLFRVVKTRNKEFYQQARKNGEWVNGVKDVRKVPYKLHQLLNAPPEETVFIVEGEKDVKNLMRHGLVATCNAGGVGKWRDEYSEFLKNRKVVIIPDNDKPGAKHARQVARSLQGKARSIKILDLPGLPPKGDVSDWLKAGGTTDELNDLVEATPEWVPDKADTEDDIGEEKPNQRPSQASLLVKLVERFAVEFFHDPMATAYCYLVVNGHRETWPILSGEFKDLMSRDFYREYRKAPNAQALADAIALLRAKARFDGPCHPVHVRVAELDGNIFLDLCDELWRVVKITPYGWEVTTDPPVKFKRTQGMLPLPEPLPGGNIQELQQYVNISEKDDFVLLVGWLVGTLRPNSPFIVLNLHGEHGCGKSTLIRVLRDLIDPHEVFATGEARNEHELFISAINSWLLATDNLSRIPNKISDALCLIASGAGKRSRQLYSDSHEHLFRVQRPIIISGIGELATRQDLLDRCITITPPAIATKFRKLESVVLTEFKEAKPRILGALLDAVSAGLKHLGEPSPSEWQRMADAEAWITSCENALPWELGAFSAAYAKNREQINETALEASPVYYPLRKLLVRNNQTWEGTSGALRFELLELVDETPKPPCLGSALAVSNAIKRIEPNLRTIGITVTRRREPDKMRSRILRIVNTKAPKRRPKRPKRPKKKQR